MRYEARGHDVYDRFQDKVLVTTRHAPKLVEALNRRLSDRMAIERLMRTNRAVV